MHVICHILFGCGCLSNLYVPCLCSCVLRRVCSTLGTFAKDLKHKRGDVSVDDPGVFSGLLRICDPSESQHCVTSARSASFKNVKLHRPGSPKTRFRTPPIILKINAKNLWGRFFVVDDCNKQRNPRYAIKKSDFSTEINVQ